MNAKDANCFSFCLLIRVDLREFAAEFLSSAKSAAELSLRLFVGMFLPLEECYPLVCAVAVGQHHADEFPRLRPEIGGSGFKFLRGPGPFHAVLPLRDRQRLDVEREP